MGVEPPLDAVGPELPPHDPIRLLDSVMVGDQWFGPMSLVVKPTRANGRGLVKLSDNPAKAIGTPQDVERYKQAVSYGERQFLMPKY